MEARFVEKQSTSTPSTSTLMEHSTNTHTCKHTHYILIRSFTLAGDRGGGWLSRRTPLSWCINIDHGVCVINQPVEIDAPHNPSPLHILTPTSALTVGIHQNRANAVLSLSARAKPETCFRWEIPPTHTLWGHAMGTRMCASGDDSWQ